MIVGFTGTDRGMSTEQYLAVRSLLKTLEVIGLHHGDCVGADAQAHRIAREIGIFISVHPPRGHSKRALCAGDIIHERKPYLVRNKDIAREGTNGLIAAPWEPHEILSSGVWSTVRYARQLGRKIWIVHREGTVRIDQKP